MEYPTKALQKHAEWNGKIEVCSTVPINNRQDLAIAYTPGVAEPCLAIAKDVQLSYKFTRRSNLVAVVTDGTAVLGLGDIGPEAAMPVMEGKCVLFKTFGGVDAFPLCIRSKDVDEIVNTVRLLAGSFGAINLEDISAPRCFEIEEKLKEVCDIPIFHDDQHGTAIVASAALLNALRLTKRNINTVKVVINGAGSAGIAVAKLLLKFGVKNLTMADKEGALYKGKAGMNSAQEEMAEVTNLERKNGSLADVLRGADVFFGLSAPNVVTGDMIKAMSPSPVVFAMSNPIPEIMPEIAFAAGAEIVGTGRSDYPNQINNLLAFPGVMRGALDARASDINVEMKMAAALAIAGLVSEKELTPYFIIPDPLDPKVGRAVAAAVKKAAVDSGVARIK